MSLLADPPLLFANGEVYGRLAGRRAPERRGKAFGAAVLTVGVWSTAMVTARDARSRTSDRAARLLLLVCAAAPVAPMVLAVMWAAARAWSA